MIDFQRRRLLQAATALVGGAYARPLWGLEAVPAFAPTPTFKPEVLFLTWQRSPTTTMTVQWIGTAEEGARRPVWFAKSGSMDWTSAAGSAKPWPLSDKQIFRTELRGLEPGTEYVFRVGLDSAERKFRTMPAKATNTIQFVSGGDAGVGKATEDTNRVAAAQDPQFVVIGGDLAYENGKDEKTFSKFLSMYSQQMDDSRGRLIPFLACIGNHEVDGGYGKPRDKAPFFYSCFDGLFTDTGFASLDFGDYMSIVLVDTNHTTPVKGEQTSWLEKTLKARETCPNVFVFNHVPSYPSYRPYQLDDNESGTGADSRKHWCPLFERYNVDAVLEHHDHTYKRTHPMLDGHVDEKRGVHFLGDGSWGKLRRPKTPEERPYLAVVDEAYHCSLHRVEGKQRFHIALSDKGKVTDVCTTTKRAST